jgi:carbon-monoxide dehydrogenase medium subunit
MLADFFIGPGETVLKVGEIVQSVDLPLPPAGAEGAYLSIGRNALGDLAIASVTVLGFTDRSTSSGYRFRIALTAVAPTVIFVEQAQQLMAEGPINEQVLEKAADIASDSCKPIDDIRASARYRREMVRTLTRRALQEVCTALQEKKSNGDINDS